MEMEALKLENQLCFPLYASARKIINLYTPHLKPLGITYTQYLVLLVLWQDHSQTVGELCKRLYLDSGTITPLLKKLEENGYITRTREAEDERVVRIELTEQGLALRDKAKEIPAKIGSCIRLDPEEAGNLYQCLYKILESTL